MVWGFFRMSTGFGEQCSIGWDGMGLGLGVHGSLAWAGLRLASWLCVVVGCGICSGVVGVFGACLCRFGVRWCLGQRRLAMLVSSRRVTFANGSVGVAK